jgi:hypothetical protein
VLGQPGLGRAQEPAHLGGQRVRRLAGLDLGGARVPVGRAPGAAQRGRRQGPGADVGAGGFGDGVPGRARGGLPRHLPGAVRGRLRRRRRRTAGQGARPAYPTFADGHDVALVCQAVAESARSGTWAPVRRDEP